MFDFVVTSNYIAQMALLEGWEEEGERERVDTSEFQILVVILM